MNVAKHAPTMLASTALLISGVNLAYTVKRVGELQKEVEELGEQMYKNKEDSSKSAMQAGELTAQMNAFQTKIQSLITRISDTEEDGISAQDDLDGLAGGLQSWAVNLIEELKVLKPDTRLQTPVVGNSGEAPAQSRGTRQASGRGHRNHHHHHPQANNNQRRRGRDDEEDDVESRFQRRRRGE